MDKLQLIGHEPVAQGLGGPSNTDGAASHLGVGGRSEAPAFGA